MGTIKKAALPATPIAARTEITMISRAFGLRPSNIIKNGSIAATITIRLHIRYFLPWKNRTDRYKSSGTTKSIRARANQVLRFTFPFFSICRMIIPSEGRVYSSRSSAGSSSCASFGISSQNSSINWSSCCYVST